MCFAFPHDPHDLSSFVGFFVSVCCCFVSPDKDQEPVFGREQTTKRVLANLTFFFMMMKNNEKILIADFEKFICQVNKLC